MVAEVAVVELALYASAALACASIATLIVAYWLARKEYGRQIEGG